MFFAFFLGLYSSSSYNKGGGIFVILQYVMCCYVQVCECVWVCMGIHECARMCTGVCAELFLGVCRYAWVCKWSAGVLRCVYGCAQMCADLRKCVCVCEYSLVCSGASFFIKFQN